MNAFPSPPLALTVALLCCAPLVSAQSTLENQLSIWVQQHQPIAADVAVHQQVRLLSRGKALDTLCAAPQFSAAGQPARMVGNRTLTAQCGSRRYFLQVEVSATGSWYVAQRTLAPGETLRAEDLRRVCGDLAALPPGALLQQQALVGQVTLRALAAGQVLTQGQLRRSWRIRQGEEVDIVAQGQGFRLRSKGKALNNAAIGQMLAVKTAAGQRVQGVVSADGKILLSLP